MPEPTFDIAQAHRWFAIELNNRSWDLVEANSCSTGELVELIDSAHASCLHWRQIGQPIHQIRSQTLLVMAHVKAGLGQTGVWYADKLLANFSITPEGITPFDSALVHAAVAAACQLVKDTTQATQHYKLATEFADKLTESAERDLFHLLFPNHT